MAIKEITIRPMTAADVPAVALMEASCFPEDAWSEDAFAAVLRNPCALFLLAWQEDTLVGYAGAYRMADEAEIVNIAVRPEHRRQGIGKALLSHLLEGNTKTRTYLEVRASNEAAIALYRRFGFTVVGTRRNYYANPREDALLMLLSFDTETR